MKNEFRAKTEKQLEDDENDLFLLFKKTYAETQKCFLTFLRDAKTKEDRDFINQLIKEVGAAYLTAKACYDK